MIGRKKEKLTIFVSNILSLLRLGKKGTMNYFDTKKGRGFKINNSQKICQALTSVLAVN